MYWVNHILQRQSYAATLSTCACSTLKRKLNNATWFSHLMPLHLFIHSRGNGILAEKVWKMLSRKHTEWLAYLCKYQLILSTVFLAISFFKQIKPAHFCGWRWKMSQVRWWPVNDANTLKCNKVFGMSVDPTEFLCFNCFVILEICISSADTGG